MFDRQLQDLFRAASKHSQYQVLPKAVLALLPQEAVEVKSRFERERLDYICQKLDVHGLTVTDIGGNTGYFSFELLDRGAALVHHIEGNQAHQQFVQHAAVQLGLSERLHSQNRYINFEQPDLPASDVTLLLNVLHHVGDDYGDPATSRESVQASMLAALKQMAPLTSWLVLQIGFNWQGNAAQPIFDKGIKSEVIELVRHAADDYDLVAVGVATRVAGEVQYIDLNAENIERDDSLGEFLNRPLFVLRSRRRMC